MISDDKFSIQEGSLLKSRNLSLNESDYEKDSTINTSFLSNNNNKNIENYIFEKKSIFRIPHSRGDVLHPILPKEFNLNNTITKSSTHSTIIDEDKSIDITSIEELSIPNYQEIGISTDTEIKKEIILNPKNPSIKSNRKRIIKKKLNII